MGIIPNYPGQIGVITSDYLETHFDKILTVADNIAAVVFVSDNYVELQTIAADAANMIDAANTLAAESALITVQLPILEGYRDEVAEDYALIQVLQGLVETDRILVLDARAATLAYKQAAENAAAAAAADAAIVQGVIDDTGVNEVNLNLGERTTATATLTYGARV